MNTEQVISWGIGLVIILLFLIPYIVRVKRKEADTKKRLEETKSRKQDKALTQHPIINRSLCIGCGICVEVCPEGDVLGLIDGKSTIIHGSHCVGHGKCAENCPVGAIEIGLGDISEREDIPQLSQNFETNIPGIYIIGELSGLALIRNAINHGIITIDHIKKTLTTKASGVYDVAIVGAGPAGMSAALRATEVGLNYILLDQSKPGGTILQYPRRKLVLVQTVELPLWGKLNKGEYSKENLLEIWEDVIKKRQLHFFPGHKLKGITGTKGDFELQSSSGIVKAAMVILALGRRGTPRKLNIAGEDLSKVSYQLLDAESFKDQRILIVGGGDSAVEAALGLAHQNGNKVAISYRQENFFRLKARNEDRISQAISNKLVKAVFNSSPIAIEKERVILKTTDGEIDLSNDYVFIFAGGELPFQLLQTIGIQFGKKVEVKN